MTNDEPFYIWDFARTVWAVAGDKTNLNDVWIIPETTSLILAILMKWIFWVLFLEQRKPDFTRQKVKFTSMTRIYSINKIKTQLGYKPLWSTNEGIKRGVIWFEEKRSKERKTTYQGSWTV